MKVLVAGATGAIGRRIVPLLIAAGHEVAATTRSAEKAAHLSALGTQPLILDAYDAVAVEGAVLAVRPDVIVNQLTDLPQTYDPEVFDEAIKRNADIRRAGTANFVRAAGAAGTPRMITQSVAFLYAAGAKPYDEAHPLDVEAGGSRRVSVEGVLACERPVLESPGIAGVVLRYGYFYGPGTWDDEPDGDPPVHVDAAAQATLLALDAEPGIYNIADDTGFVSIDRARRILGWDPGFRMPA